MKVMDKICGVETKDFSSISFLRKMKRKFAFYEALFALKVSYIMLDMSDAH